MSEQPTPRLLFRHGARAQWLLLHGPCHVISATRLTDVLPALRQVETAVAGGLYAGGFVSHEATPAFDAALTVRTDAQQSAVPLVWFALCEATGITWLNELPDAPEETTTPHHWSGAPTSLAYAESLRRIHRYIHDGDIYQVNFTHRLHSNAPDDPWNLFVHMMAAQQAAYGAYVDTGDHVICSASPELFFSLENSLITSRPMKGTAPRGLWSADDLQQAQRLRQSPKERAENLMIVDMVRNDLGRISLTGTVKVPTLFALEKYPTLWQMTSTVQSRSDAGLADLFQALFPPASVTGVPKRRALEIIAELESSPRGLYTGAVGFCLPQRRWQFNVAIRSCVIHRSTGMAEYGVGGGIVWDSIIDREAEEWEIKTRILQARRPPFDLLETMLWTPEDGYALLDGHLQRLAASAEYFSIPLAVDRLRQQLQQAAAHFAKVPLRVRLLINRQGQMTLEQRALTDLPQPANVLPLASLPFTAATRRDVFLYHKTTCRHLYQQALEALPGVQDVLLWNESREVTESTIANFAYRQGGQMYTPPLGCGLLPGVFRQQELAAGRMQERPLKIDDMGKTDGLFLMNSVRGLWPITLLSQGVSDQ